MHDTFAFADIHGMYDLYKAIMNYCNEQDPEATIIFCGDACDRGPDGYKIMRELLDNPRVIYLKGNHEDIFVNAAKELNHAFNLRGVTKEEARTILYNTLGFDSKYNNTGLSIYNGGINTLTDWIVDGMSMEFVEQIDNLPYTCSTNTHDFCHSAGIYQTFKKVCDTEDAGITPDKYESDALIWGRTGLDMGWAPNRTAVFGHTPVPFLYELIGIDVPKDKPAFPVQYVSDFIPEYNGAKIDMDTGACFLGRAFVLNALTGWAQGFEDVDIENKQKHPHTIKKIDCIKM